MHCQCGGSWTDFLNLKEFEMKCYICEMEIEGIATRCGCTLCNGAEGQITVDGKVVGRIWKDSAYHATNLLTENPRDCCIAALKLHIASLENRSI